MYHLNTAKRALHMLLRTLKWRDTGYMGVSPVVKKIHIWGEADVMRAKARVVL